MTRIRIDLIEKELSYQLVGLLYKVHRELGRYCREKQYSDALASLLKEERILYKREMPIETNGRESNFVDFCIENKILVEVKVRPLITRENYFQIQRYLKASNKELGLLVNFRQKVLKPKRILNSEFKKVN